VTDPAPRRAVPIAAPRLGDELERDDAVGLADHERLEDREVHDLELGDDALEGPELRRCRLVQPAWTGGHLVRAELSDVVLEDGELAGLTLDECTLQRVTFVRCRLSGLVAPALKATDVTFVGCRMDDAWLRAATLERVAVDECALPRADLYAARLQHVRLVGCDLTEVELSQAQLDDVAFHGSTIEGLKGGAALRNAVIGVDQVLSFAGPVLHAAGIRVDDDYLDPPDG
jgi:uncharacterized protein YjbI with pentapeptide repeats